VNTSPIDDGQNHRMIHGDCVTTMADMPDQCMDMSVFSPPFASLFAYSGELADIGNSHDGDGEFKLHMLFFWHQAFRIMKPGRILCCHIANVTWTKRTFGREGIRDLRGLMIRLAERAGFWLHGEIGIQKNPQAQAIRTKSKGLLFARLESDHLNSRPALADYILILKRPGDVTVPVTSDLSDAGDKRSERETWIKWAQPFWDDIRESNTLNVRGSKGPDDTRHICPLQLDVIKRCVRLYSNLGEIVFSPFAGIGSEGFVALLEGRRFVGCELKDEYYHTAIKNLTAAERQRDQEQMPLFAET
jgi:DNA modification methylase